MNYIRILSFPVQLHNYTDVLHWTYGITLDPLSLETMSSTQYTHWSAPSVTSVQLLPILCVWCHARVTLPVPLPLPVLLLSVAPTGNGGRGRSGLSFTVRGGSVRLRYCQRLQLGPCRIALPCSRAVLVPSLATWPRAVLAISTIQKILRHHRHMRGGCEMQQAQLQQCAKWIVRQCLTFWISPLT